MSAVAGSPESFGSITGDAELESKRLTRFQWPTIHSVVPLRLDNMENNALSGLASQPDRQNQRSRRDTSVSVRCDELRISQFVSEGQDAVRTQRLPWDRVAQVVAYRRDLLTIDQICLAIVCDDPEESIEVSEDDDGYKHLIEELPKRPTEFPAPEEWWQKIALPPFETQWTRLYSRNM